MGQSFQSRLDEVKSISEAVRGAKKIIVAGGTEVTLQLAGDVWEQFRKHKGAMIGAFFLIYLGIFYLKAGLRNDAEFAWDSIKCRAGILPILFGSLVLTQRINRGFLLLVPLDLAGALWTWSTLP